MRDESDEWSRLSAVLFVPTFQLGMGTSGAGIKAVPFRLSAVIAQN